MTKVQRTVGYQVDLICNTDAHNLQQKPECIENSHFYYKINVLFHFQFIKIKHILMCCFITISEYLFAPLHVCPLFRGTKRLNVYSISAAKVRMSILKHQNEPQHDKTNKMSCAPNEDSEKPVNPPNLIRLFAVYSKDTQGPNTFSCGQQRP